MAKSREKMLAKMATFESVVIDPTVKFNIKSPGPVSGGFGIRLVDVGFGFPGRPPLFQHVEFSINQNSRVWCVRTVNNTDTFCSCFVVTRLPAQPCWPQRHW